MMKWIAPTLLMVALAASGCQSQPKSQSMPVETIDAVVKNEPLNDGYSLLHELVSKQKRVSAVLILPFKKISDPTRQLVRDIAKASEEAAAKLASFAAADASLKLDAAMLSPVEKATRASIESVVSRRILSAGGADFELQLLLSQVDATDYGATLARQVAEFDENAQRKQWLTEFAGRYGQLHQRAVERLTVK